MSILSWIRKRSEKLVEDTFYKIGDILWMKPWIFLIIGIILLSIGGCGWIFVGIEFNEMNLWLSSDDDNYQQQSYDFLVNNYANNNALIPSQTNFFSFIAKSNDNILTNNTLLRIYQFEQLLLNFTFKNKTYKEYCHKPYLNASNCSTHSLNLFYLFDYDKNKISNNSMIHNVLSNGNYIISNHKNTFNYGDFMEIWFGQNIWKDHDENIEINYSINSANYVLFNYYFITSTTKETEDEIYEFIDELDKYLTSLNNDNFFASNIDISIGSTVLIKNDLIKIVINASYYFLISICILFIWSIGLRSGIKGIFINPCIWFRFWLSISIILTVCCSVLFGFGIGFYRGRQFNYVCTLVPFLLLGIGVNNMMIIVDTFIHGQIVYFNNINDKQRFKLSLTQSGHSITLTFISCTVAFLIGFTPNIPAVNSFCSFTIWCFFGQYLFQFLIFIPLFVIDYKRCIDNRNCILFCIKHDIDDNNINNHDRNDRKIHNVPNDEEDKNEIIALTEQQHTDNDKKQNKNGEIYTKINTDDDDQKDEIVENADINNDDDGDDKSDEEKEIELNGDDDDCVRIEAQLWVERLLWRLNANYLFRNKIIALIITLIAFTIFGLSIWAALSIEGEMDVGQSRLLVFPSDSPMIEYYDTLDIMYPDKFVTDSHFMIQNIDISDEIQRNKILNYTENLNKMDEEYIVTKVDEWITKYDQWLQSEYNLSINDVSGDNERFYGLLRNEFLNEYKIYDKLIIFEEIDDENMNFTNIYSTKLMRYSYATTPINQYYKMENIYKDIGDKSNLNTFYFDEFMVYGNLADTQQKRVWTVFGWSVLTIFCVELMFASPLILFLVIIGIVMINITLFGWMYINDLIMTPIIFTFFTFSVGLTSNYMIYTTHYLIYYLKEKDLNIKKKNKAYYNKRIDFVLISIQKYSFLGFMTTFISILPLCFTDVIQFFNVFIMLSGLMFITLMYNFLFMPIITIWLLPILQCIAIKMDKFKNKPKKTKHCCGWVCYGGCCCPWKWKKELKSVGCCKWESIHEQDQNQKDTKNT